MGGPANRGCGCARGERPLVRLGQGAFTREIRGGSPAGPIDLAFLLREPADVYHAKARHYLSSHQLADFRRSPALYRKKQLGLIHERRSAAFLIGRATHTLILEGRERFEAEYAIGGPVNPQTGKPYDKRSKAYAEWKASVGRPVLDDSQAALIEQMAASVRNHLFARELLREGVAEGVVRRELAGAACQSRLDWVSPVEGRGLVDLKTCDTLDAFESDFRAHGYAHQLAFYRAMVERATGLLLPAHVIAVEKSEPIRCGVWQIAPAVLDAAHEQNLAAIAELARCRETGVWPTRFESLRLIGRL